MGQFNDFRNKTLKEIKIWAWLAAVMPIMALAGIFFIWVFGTKELFDWALIVGETIMFTTAVVWWWWAIYVIRKLLNQWESTRINVSEILDELRSVKGVIQTTLKDTDDK